MRKKHGGRRKGAGRRPLSGLEGIKPYSVSLDEVTVAKAKELGSGSLSGGIRAKFMEV